MEWKKLTYNEVLQCGDFYISYNPSTTNSPLNKLMTELGNTIMKSSEVDHEFSDGEETALSLPSENGEKRGDMWILKGDFRKEYEELAPKGIEACKEFFMKNVHLASSWSEHHTPWLKEEDSQV